MKNDGIKTYLSFNLKSELYAVDVHQVIEVLEQQKITKVPDSPDYIKGIINFRGDVVPVLHLAGKLNIDTATSEKFVIIVLELKRNKSNLRVGMICDNVRNVLRFENNEIHEIPELGSHINSEYVHAIVKYNNDIIIILNINSIFFSETNDIQVSLEKKNQEK